MIIDEQNYIIHVVHSVAVVDGLALNDHGSGRGRYVCNQIDIQTSN